MQTTSRLEAIRQLRRRWYGNDTVLILAESDDGDETLWIHRDDSGKIILVNAIEDSENPYEREITARELLQQIKMRFERFPRVFVNAYEVDQHYGGPEEGNWYYFSGTPLASVPVLKKGDAVEREEERLKSVFDEYFYEGKRPCTSVIGTPDFDVRVEPHMAESWPKQRPHYE